MEKMENGNLAIGKAHEPQEEAGQPLIRDVTKCKGKRNKHSIAFAENEKHDSQTSSAYEVHLSQPSPGLTHLQKLIWLQSKRTRGLWAQCDDCDKWRYLPDILDRYELPRKWFCRMNTDKSLASCSAPESPIHLHDEEDLIHNEYSAGSLVLARVPGWPCWPAMVDDCPDTEQFYWLDGFSDIPTHYHVVFFDQYEVTRAWIDPSNLKPYSKQKNILEMSSKCKKYRNRLEAAVVQADDAETLSLVDRLKKYSFISRYKGPIRKPIKVTKKYKQKFEKRFKRKYNIDLGHDTSDSESSDDEDFNYDISHENIIKKATKKVKVLKESDATEKSDDPGQNDSLVAVQGTIKSDLNEVSLTNGSSNNIVMETEENKETSNTQINENRSQSPASDNFDF